MTLNEKIEVAWEALRAAREGLSTTERRTFDLRFEHVIAKELDTTVERVRQRIKKIERRKADAHAD